MMWEMASYIQQLSSRKTYLKTLFLLQQCFLLLPTIQQFRMIWCMLWIAMLWNRDLKGKNLKIRYHESFLVLVEKWRKMKMIFIVTEACIDIIYDIISEYVKETNQPWWTLSNRLGRERRSTKFQSSMLFTTSQSIPKNYQFNQCSLLGL